MRNGVLTLMTIVMSSASGSVAGYHVEPVKASWSGWTPQYGNVSQTVVCCWDSLETISLFAGAKGNGGAYYVTVKTAALR